MLISSSGSESSLESMRPTKNQSRASAAARPSGQVGDNRNGPAKMVKSQSSPAADSFAELSDSSRYARRPADSLFCQVQLARLVHPRTHICNRLPV